jgi:hypothetical protein
MIISSGGYMHRHYSKTFLSIISTILLAVPVGAETLTSDHLDRQARGYLEFLDQNNFEEAWEEMSDLFRSLNNKTHWQNQQQVIRSIYGPLSFRQLLRFSYRQSYSLSPDGEYVIVQYKSGYQNRTDTVETVVFDCRNDPECSIREYIIK